MKCFMTFFVLKLLLISKETDLTDSYQVTYLLYRKLDQHCRNHSPKETEKF